MGGQPVQLRRGRAFEKRVQDDWELTAEGKPKTEKTIELIAGLTPTGRGKRGRMDIFVNDVGDFVVVVEIKATDWDRPSQTLAVISPHAETTTELTVSYSH